MDQSLMHILSESQLHAETDVHTQASGAVQCRFYLKLDQFVAQNVRQFHVGTT